MINKNKFLFISYKPALSLTMSSSLNPTIVSVEKDNRSGTEVIIKGTAVYSDNSSVLFPPNILSIIGFQSQKTGLPNLLGAIEITPNNTLWEFRTSPLPNGTYVFMARRTIDGTSFDSTLSDPVTISNSPGTFPSTPSSPSPSPTSSRGIIVIPSTTPSVPKIPRLFYGVLTLEAITLVVLFFVPNSDFCKNNRIPCATFFGLWFCLLLILNSILASQIHSLNEMQKGLIGSLIAITYLSCIVLLVVIYQLNPLDQNSSPRSQRRSGIIQMGGGGRGYMGVPKQGQR